MRRDTTMDLFSNPPALARVTDPGTSHIAAASVTPSIQSLQREILDVLKSGGLTTHEIADASGIEWGSVTPRMLPMEDAGLVRRNGTRIPPGRKRPSIVWEAV